MEVADTIAVMNKGQIEQVGAPRRLRQARQPVRDGLPGAGQHGLGRPHDVSISLSADSGLIEAMVKRVVHLGFEVRVELELKGGEPARVQLTRAQAEQLEINNGDIVYVRPPVRAAVTGDPAEADIAGEETALSA